MHEYLIPTNTILMFLLHSNLALQIQTALERLNAIIIIDRWLVINYIPASRYML